MWGADPNEAFSCLVRGKTFLGFGLGVAQGYGHVGRHVWMFFAWLFSCKHLELLGDLLHYFVNLLLNFYHVPLPGWPLREFPYKFQELLVFFKNHPGLWFDLQFLVELFALLKELTNDFVSFVLDLVGERHLRIQIFLRVNRLTWLLIVLIAILAIFFIILLLLIILLLIILSIIGSRPRTWPRLLCLAHCTLRLLLPLPCLTTLLFGTFVIIITTCFEPGIEVAQGTWGGTLQELN